MFRNISQSIENFLTTVMGLESKENVGKKFIYKVGRSHPLPEVPVEIDLKDLNHDGTMVVTQTDKIDELIQERLEKFDTSGRIRKRDHEEFVPIEDEKKSDDDLFIQETALRKETVKGSGSNCGAEFVHDNKKTHVFYIYKKKIGQGGQGKIKAMMKKRENPRETATDLYRVLKIQKLRLSEFKHSKKLKLAEKQVLRHSPSHLFSSQQEIIMKWMPGDMLETLCTGDILKGRFPKKLHPVFIMKILINLGKQVQALHEAGILHRDIKTENFMIHGTDAKLIDMGFAEKTGGKPYVNTEVFAGSFGYVHPKIAEEGIWDVETDLYGLGICMAEWLGLISDQSLSDANPYIDPEDFVKEKNGYQLVAENDEKFVGNTNLPPEVLKEVLNLTNQLIGHAESKTPVTAKACAEKLTTLYQAIEKTPIDSTVVNITEYLASSDEEKKAFVNKAQKFSYIQFVWTGDVKPTEKQMIEVSREFNSFAKKHLLSKQVLHVGADLTELPQVLHQYSDPSLVYQYQFLTCRTLTINENRALNGIIPVNHLSANENQLYAAQNLRQTQREDGKQLEPQVVSLFF
jgi:serine/threonine protein kinase